METDIEAQTLSKENQRLRHRIWQRDIIIRILLSVIAMAIIVAAGAALAAAP